MADWTRRELNRHNRDAHGLIEMERFDHPSGATVMLYMDTRGLEKVYEAHFFPPEDQRVNSITNPLFIESDPDLLTSRVIRWTAGYSGLGLGESGESASNGDANTEKETGGFVFGNVEDAS